MYTAPPGKAELAMLGLTEEEVNPDVEIWPDNVETVQCFIALSTQWKTGMNGVTGLDYAAVFVVMEMIGIKDKQAVFGGLQVMEMEALKLMRVARPD